MNKYNLGLSALKFLCCLGVVWVHNAVGGGVLTSICVPLFIAIAIYLSEKGINQGDYLWLGHRIVRLYMPLWFWSTISLLFISFIDRRAFPLKDLVLQFTLGHVVSCPLYFLFVLSALTVLLFLVRKIIPTRRGELFICLLLILLSLFAQYINLATRMLPSVSNSVILPLGRLIELVPPACVGSFIARYENMPMVRRKKVYAAIVLLFLVFGILRILHVVVWPSDFGYGGVLLPCATFLILAPIVSYGSRIEIGRSVITKLGAMSAGIYYVHSIVGYLITKYYPMALSPIRFLVILVTSTVLVLTLVKVVSLRKVLL